jgi:copper/silver efflux system protein
VFSGIAVAWAGGFLMIWFYGQDWFANFSLFGVNMRELFQLHAINLSVAVWVGFLALFGIAVDDGVVMATYLKQSFDKAAPPKPWRSCARPPVAAGLRRVRPCLMTSATTILALLPVLTATGRGADIMIPMAIPSVGGMSAGAADHVHRAGAVLPGEHDEEMFRDKFWLSLALTKSSATGSRCVRLTRPKAR